MNKPPAGFGAYCSTASLPITVKGENTTKQCPFLTNMPRRLCTLSQSQGAARCHAGTSWDLATLRTEQLNDQDIGPIPEEVDTGQCPEWKDVPDPKPKYKRYWAQWKSLAMRNGMLEHHWEFPDRQLKIAQLILTWSKMKDMLTELHDGPLGGHLGVKKTLDKVWQRYYCSRQETLLRSDARSSTPVQ